MSKDVLLEINHLQTYFFTENGVMKSVDGVSFQVNKGETVAIVGESGCGKSVTSLSIMGLVKPPGKIIGGEILFQDQNLLDLSKKDIKKIRGNQISMIFQEPLSSLNPVLKIGNQIAEVLNLHQQLTKKEAKNRTIELLKKVGIPRAEQVYNSYPHALSGGMRQRVMIAMAVSCNPNLLIADEPTTALDVTIQAQILLLMKQLSREFNTSIMIITHDLGVVAEIADRVVVMYAGQVVEESDVYTIFKNPKHPYTKGLLNSTPRIHEIKNKLDPIEGNVPPPNNLPKGCRFHTRCSYATEKCFETEPQLENTSANQKVRCWLYREEVIGE